MSDDDEIVRLETMLLKAATTLLGKYLVTLGCYEHRFGWNAYLAARGDCLVDGDNVNAATKLEALCNLRDVLRKELVRRRDEHNAAIAMLGSE